MRVILAGYNVDVEGLDGLRECIGEAARCLPGGETGEASAEAAREAGGRCRLLARRENLTPETISAAYARISRDKRPVDELRRVAREEVDEARRSNRTIIFGLGHASVAEHAVFNLDVIGISRLAVEFLEGFRLASFTEKSQRYVVFNGDYAVPEALAGTPLEADFRATVEAQNSAYRRLYELARDHLARTRPLPPGDRQALRQREGMAKEDARYVIPLATLTQLGATINGRTLEQVIRHAASHPRTEVRELGRRIRDAVEGVAPSLVKYLEPSDYLSDTRPALAELCRRLADENRRDTDGMVSRLRQALPADRDVRLFYATANGDGRILAGLIHGATGLPVDEAHLQALALDEVQRRTLYREALRRLERHDHLPREFELAELVYEITLSAAAYAQLKRHRMATILPQPYEPDLGCTRPPLIEECGGTALFDETMERTAEAYRRLLPAGREAADYLLTNAHRRRVLFKCNLRELAHLVRLRDDTHAQWDIRRIAASMARIARQSMPYATLLICGKDVFDEVKSSAMGN